MKKTLCLILLILISTNLSFAEKKWLRLKDFNGGGEISSGHITRLRWEHSVGINNISVYLWDHYQSKLIPVNSYISDDDKSIILFIPDNISGEKFRLKIESVDDPRVNYLSRSYFKITSSRSKKPIIEEYENGFNSGIEVFPLPAIDVITINSIKKKIKTIRIYSLDGLLLNTIKIDNKFDCLLNVSKYEKGVYLIEINYIDDVHCFRKIIKS